MSGHVTAKLRTPRVPGEIFLEIPGMIGQYPKVSLGSLSDEQIDQLAAQWHQALKAKAIEQRRNEADGKQPVYRGSAKRTEI